MKQPQVMIMRKRNKWELVQAQLLHPRPGAIAGRDRMGSPGIARERQGAPGSARERQGSLRISDDEDEAQLVGMIVERWSRSRDYRLNAVV